MIQRQPFNQLFLIMATAALLVSAVSIYSLYRTATEQHGLRLLDTVKSQARLIETIAQFDNLEIGGNDPALARQATLEKVADAHQNFIGFGQSGEFVLAVRDGDQIHFVLNRRHEPSPTSLSIPFAGEWAEPMRQALSGNSGIITAPDYRGVEVLAAFEPISILDFGLVAKIDTAEIRAPFLSAAMIALAITLLVIFIASRFFFRVSRPIERIIDQQAETFRTLAETAREAIVIASTRGIIQFVNPATERLFGYKPGELHGMSIKSLMPDEQRQHHDRYVERYLHTGFARIIGSGRQLVAKRKDGKHFPIYLSLGDIRTSHERLFAGVILDMSEERQLQREVLGISVGEQRRIGQELHDGLGQQLTGLGLLATSLLNKASKPDHALARQLAAGLQDAISQVRALSRGLMPVNIDAGGLAGALEILVDELRLQNDIEVELVNNEQVRVADNGSALHLYRIAQEALNNAIRHSGASRIEISLGKVGSRGYLSIRDNGNGFERDTHQSRGLGLRIMQHRCGMIDAEFMIESSIEHGTEVKCHFTIEP